MLFKSILATLALVQAAISQQDIPFCLVSLEPSLHSQMHH